MQTLDYVKLQELIRKSGDNNVLGISYQTLSMNQQRKTDTRKSTYGCGTDDMYDQVDCRR